VLRWKRNRGDPERRVPAFAAVLDGVERAKGALVAAVPSARAPGHPLADALFSFEAGLREAADGMDAWRNDAVSQVWVACGDGLAESLRRAERLRLDAPDLEFESLIAIVADLIAPLDAFEQAEERLRELRLR
jgi:hypothetical protein